MILAHLVTLAASFAALAPTGPSAGGNVLIVDDDGGMGASFTDLQPAIDAATDGDILLVRGGTYSAFRIDGKALVVHGAPGDDVLVRSVSVIPADVRNLAPLQHVVIRGIDMDGGTLGFVFPSVPTWTRALSVADNAGSVWIEDCRVVGTAGGAEVRDSAAVVFLRSELRGYDLEGNINLLGRPGGPGIESESSNVHLHGCSLEGGDGSSFEGLTAADGGHGAEVLGGLLFASSTSFSGGKGGNSVVECAVAGDGLRLGSGAPAVWTLESTFQGGAANAGFFCTSASGLGVAVTSGAHNVLRGDALRLRAESPAAEGGPVTLEIGGPPGTPVAVAVGLEPAAGFVPTLGSVLVAPPRALVPLGVLPATGVLRVRAPLARGPEPHVVRVQVLSEVRGELVTGAASTVLLLARDSAVRAR